MCKFAPDDTSSVVGICWLTWAISGDAFSLATPRRMYKEHMMMHGQKRKIITRDAQVPFQFKFHICNGLTNQKLQLLDGALAGLFLGAQIVLPKTIVLNGAQFVSVTDQNRQPLDHMFNMTRFETMIQQVQLGQYGFHFFLTRKINTK